MALEASGGIRTQAITNINFNDPRFGNSEVNHMAILDRISGFYNSWLQVGGEDLTINGLPAKKIIKDNDLPEYWIMLSKEVFVLISFKIPEGGDQSYKDWLDISTFKFIP